MPVNCAVIGAAALMSIWIARPAMAQCQWSPLGSGVNAQVYALALFDNGNGPALYAGGNFTSAGGQPAGYIAKWDGSQWTPLGSGTNQTVFALTVFDDANGPALYAGGDFQTADGMDARGVAKWDRGHWTGVGSDFNGPVYALAVFDDGNGAALYAGGHFSRAAADVPAGNIAKFDGAQWSALDAGTNSDVRAITVFDDGTRSELYAGGLFTTAGGMLASGIAKWDGTAWAPLGSGLTDAGQVEALTTFDDGTGLALYAGGWFYSAGGMPANNIAKWDGTHWQSPIGRGDWFVTSAFAWFGTGPLYVGGSFAPVIDGAQYNKVAAWDGMQWSRLGNGMNAHGVNALAAFNDGVNPPVLYAGGEFTMAGGVPANNIARWSCGQ